ncbi:tRNA (adenosine(37)-N6)-threonylcarbamoyltransferase complex ATPase subunit type 1 TsaE, partial [Bacillus thuringiensis]|nr:tRNA (adenosine(37)-N6)-threonylcarbamoyltransferase complex ATPase subunit type 1 TsaE [Bacillus thuringiensis]
DSTKRLIKFDVHGKRSEKWLEDALTEFKK